MRGKFACHLRQRSADAQSGCSYSVCIRDRYSHAPCADAVFFVVHGMTLGDHKLQFSEQLGQAGDGFGRPLL